MALQPIGCKTTALRLQKHYNPFAVKRLIVSALLYQSRAQVVPTPTLAFGMTGESGPFESGPLGAVHLSRHKWPTLNRGCSSARLLKGAGRFGSAIHFFNSAALHGRLTFGDLFQGSGVARPESGSSRRVATGVPRP